MNNSSQINADKIVSNRKALYGWGLVFIFWTLIGFSATIQTYIHYSIHIDEKNEGFSWFHYLIEVLPPWYYWALITPIIFWISRKFPFERKQSVLLTFLIHLFISVILTIPYLGIAAFFYRISIDLPVTLTGIWQSTLSRIVSRFNFALLTYWAVLGFGFALDYYKQLQKREIQSAKIELELENQLITAKLDVLKMQLHPHFLFNTLNSVSGIMGNNLKGARRMLANLSELLRFNLESSTQQTISLKKEVELLNFYLDIERERFKDNLDVKISVQEETWKYKVPQFILQPLVENAIKHGISNADTKGVIKIDVFKEKEYLAIQIKDNGKGFPKKLKQGIGLRNTIKRLEKLYKVNYEFDLKATKTEGTIVSLKIPLKTAKYNKNNG